MFYMFHDIKIMKLITIISLSCDVRVPINWIIDNIFSDAFQFVIGTN